MDWDNFARLAVRTDLVRQIIELPTGFAQSDDESSQLPAQGLDALLEVAVDRVHAHIPRPATRERAIRAALDRGRPPSADPVAADLSRPISAACFLPLLVPLGVETLIVGVELQTWSSTYD